MNSLEPLPPVLAALVEIEAAAICARYRITHEEALEAAAGAWLNSRELLELARDCSEPHAISRTACFKRAVKAARMKVYYSLRRYKNHGEALHNISAHLPELAAGPGAEAAQSLIEQLLRSHASTRERFDSVSELYDRVLAAVSSAETIIDIGCGLHPLQFPFARWAPRLRLYAALDRDPSVITVAREFSRLVPEVRIAVQQWELADGWRLLGDTMPPGGFDLALCFKLIPVIARQQPALLEHLTKIPARRWVITASRTSLTKRRSIESREAAVVERFLTRCKVTVAEHFKTADELVWIVQRRDRP